MANLPQNTQYVTPHGAAQPGATPQPAGLSAYTGLLAKMKGLPSPTAAFARPNSGMPNFTAQPAGQVPLNEPAVPAPDPSRYNQIPDWYSGFQPARNVGGYQISAPTEGQTFIENMPGIPGQMVVDKSNPGSLIHSNRAYTPEEDFQMLGGRSSKLYQVDHVIPLWAGGADTPYNKQVLTINQHDLKTRSQAVALTLMAHGKITPTLARSMALSWQDHDNTDLPEVGSNGLISITDAEKIAQRWRDQSTEDMTGFAGSISAIKKNGNGSFWRGLLNEIPEGTKSVVHALGNFGKGYLPDPVQDVVGGLLEGGASGLTAGWASAPDENPTVTRQAAEIVGNIGGMLIPVGLISKGFGMSVKGIRGLSSLSKMAAADAGFAEAGGEAVGALQQAAIDAGIQSPSYLQKLGGLSGIMRNVPGFTLYGQMSPRGELGKLAGVEDAHPVQQFFNDLSFGVASGVIPPGIRGAAPMAAVALITGPIFDPEHPSNWLVNAGVMASLHAISNYSVPARMGGRVFESTMSGGTGVPERTATYDAVMKQYNDNVTRYVVNNVLRPYAGESIPAIKRGEPVPSLYTGNAETDSQTAQRVGQWTQDALENLYKAASGNAEASGKLGYSPSEIKNMDYADWQAEAKKIVAAGRHLYKQTLDPVARAEADAKDLMSVAETVKKSPQKPDRPFNEPTVASVAKDTIDQKMMTDSYKKYDTIPQSGENPVGTVPLTGIASNVNANPEKIQYFFQKLSEGKAAPTIILVDRPDTAPFWRNMNMTFDPQAVKDNKVTPFAHPENAVQAFGIVQGEKGRELVPLGWVSRKSRIDDRENSWNSHPAVQKYINSNGQEGLRPFDSNLNKDSIAENMRKNGIRVLLANLDYSAHGPTYTSGATAKTKIAQEPFLPITLNDHNWSASKEFSKKLISPERMKAETLPELISEVNSSVDGIEQKQAIEEIKNRIQEPAHMVLDKAPESISADPVHKVVASDFIGSFKNAVDGTSPQSIINSLSEQFGVIIDEATAKDLFARRHELTVRDIFNTVADAEENLWVDGATTQTIREFVKPMFESPEFKAWSMSKVFPDLRVAGGLKTGKKPPLGQLVLPMEEASNKTTARIPKTEEPVVKANIPEVKANGPEVKANGPEVKANGPEVKANGPEVTANTPEVTANQESAPIQESAFGQSPLVKKIMSMAEDMGVNADDTPIETPTVPSGVSHTLPDTNTPQTQKSILKEAANELYTRGMGILDSVDPSYYTREGMERGGAKAYAGALMNLIRKIEPGPGAGKYAQQVKTAVSKELIRKAKIQVKNGFDSNVDEFGEARQMSWEEVDNIFARLIGEKEIISEHGSPQSWRNIQKILRDKPESVHAPSELTEAKAEEKQKGNFFEKDPFFNTSEYDVLTARRAKAGNELIDWINFGKEAQPESYLHAFSYGMDTGLINMFGKDYHDPKIMQLLGRAFGSEAKASRKMRDIYSTENNAKEMKPITQSKGFLFSMGAGDRPGMKAAENARMKEVKTEQTDSAIRNNNEDASIPEDVKDLVGSGEMRITPDTQADKVIGLTKADTELMPGFTSLINEAIDENPQSPTFGKTLSFDSADADTARRGIEDARNVLQFILNIHNDSVTTGKKFGSKSKQDYLNLTGKKQYTGKWASLNASQRESIKKNTDSFFDNMYVRYMQSIGASIPERYSSIVKSMSAQK